MANGFNKGHSSKFCEGSQGRQTPEEGHIVVEIMMKTIVWKPLMINFLQMLIIA